MNLNIQFNIDVKQIRDRSFVATINSIDKYSDLTIKSSVSSSETIKECLEKVKTELQLIVTQYEQHYAIKG